MTKLYVVVKNEIIHEIDTSKGDVTALPLFGADMALLNESHIEAMKRNLACTEKDIFDAMEIVDKRAELLDE